MRHREVTHQGQTQAGPKIYIYTLFRNFIDIERISIKIATEAQMTFLWVYLDFQLDLWHGKNSVNLTRKSAFHEIQDRKSWILFTT